MLATQTILTPSYLDQPLSELWQAISPHYAIDESDWLKQLIPLATATDNEQQPMKNRATQWIEAVRTDKNAVQMMDALLLEYGLDSQEGVQLMCLAEALIRIPDADTAQALIVDKLGVADWQAHLSQSDSWFVNASTWGLMLTGKVVSFDEQRWGSAKEVLANLSKRLSEPMIHLAMQQAMKVMGQQFVLGQTMPEALKKTQSQPEKVGKGGQTGVRYSFDMLGEAALTQADAEKYAEDYRAAIQAVGQTNPTNPPNPWDANTVSIKLSALHPRYEVANRERVMRELLATLVDLIAYAKSLDVGITIDAEEANRLELSLQLFEALYTHPKLRGWGKLGLVVQAYSKRALPVLVWLAALAKQQGDIIPLRLVKGAYWDSEIKQSQQQGYVGYPVFTRKEATDSAYLACARFLLQPHMPALIYPQFATHNAQTIAAIAIMAGNCPFEYQRLHGMAATLYQYVRQPDKQNDSSSRLPALRIYAPIGSYQDLLPYLVRRLLENGANSSFVHRLLDADCPVSELVIHPTDKLCAQTPLHNPHIPSPHEIYSSARRNSAGVNLDVDSIKTPFYQSLTPFAVDAGYTWQACSIIAGQDVIPSASDDSTAIRVLSPHHLAEEVGSVAFASTQQVTQAIDCAESGLANWQAAPVVERAACLCRAADLLETHQAELIMLCQREAGKTIHDSIDEIREAVDFCRYYARQAEQHFAQHSPANSVGGHYIGRGIFACISPWNFPLAIFLGQISAALVAGNTVIAKPAEQTNLIAYRAVQLLFKAGIPSTALQLVLGGREVGATITCDARIAGIAFTGSTETAQKINQSLSQRAVLPVPVIAETGGQNAMLVDSTALSEQVVRDVLRSAFASAGQRCSALRVLYVQEDVAKHVMNLIAGAMAELSVGDPLLHTTDVGPVIDQTASDKLRNHIEHLRKTARLIAEAPLTAACQYGHFIAPIAFEIGAISELNEEHFGPILHVVRYAAKDLNAVIEQINQTGYGLTFGMHSRIESRYRQVAKAIRAGNVYINRDQVGAVVGVQPFGGCGLSGTGPKAGGPHYLYRFARAS